MEQHHHLDAGRDDRRRHAAHHHGAGRARHREVGRAEPRRRRHDGRRRDRRLRRRPRHAAARRSARSPAWPPARRCRCIFAVADADADGEPGRLGPGALDLRRRAVGVHRQAVRVGDAARRCRRSGFRCSPTFPVLGPDALRSAVARVRARGRCSPPSSGSCTAAAPGLVLRAVGESPTSAHSIGYPVIRIRYLATIFGGAMAGMGGAFLSVFYTPLWVEGMVAGRGWIALALVVFATWRPLRVLVGAYLFGGVMIAQLFVQGSGAQIEIPSQFLSSLPYLGDDHRARRHLAEPQDDPAQFAGIARAALPAGCAMIARALRRGEGHARRAFAAGAARRSGFAASPRRRLARCIATEESSNVDRRGWLRLAAALGGVGTLRRARSPRTRRRASASST